MFEGIFRAFRVGKRGEDVGEGFLRRKGYQILERNYTYQRGYKLGEIDIVAQIQSEVIFVEVKTRICAEKVRQTLLPPEMSITHQKLRAMEKTAFLYMREKQRENTPYRFDALLILLDSRGSVREIRHKEGIFL